MGEKLYGRHGYARQGAAYSAGSVSYNALRKSKFRNLPVKALLVLSFIAVWQMGGELPEDLRYMPAATETQTKNLRSKDTNAPVAAPETDRPTESPVRSEPYPEVNLGNQHIDSDASQFDSGSDDDTETDTDGASSAPGDGIGSGTAAPTSAESTGDSSNEEDDTNGASSAPGDGIGSGTAAPTSAESTGDSSNEEGDTNGASSAPGDGIGSGTAAPTSAESTGDSSNELEVETEETALTSLSNNTKNETETNEEKSDNPEATDLSLLNTTATETVVASLSNNTKNETETNGEKNDDPEVTDLSLLNSTETETEIVLASLSNNTKNGTDPEGTEKSLASFSNNTMNETETNKEKTDGTEVADLSLSNSTTTDTAIALSSNQTTAANSTTSSNQMETTSSNQTETSSGNQTEVKSDSNNDDSNTTDPVLLTNETANGEPNTGLDKPQLESMVAANKTESLDVSNNSTDSATAIVLPDASNATNATNNSTDGAIEESSGNDSPPLTSTANQTETQGGLSAAEEQHALWKATKEEFDETKPWKDPSVFTTVDRGVYKQMVEKAQIAVQSVVEDVYTDCEMYLLPADAEGETPKVRYKCLKDDDPALREDLCHTVNMCRVVLDEEAWTKAGTLGSSNTTSTNSSVSDSSKKSALLMMVDSIEYMMETNVFEGMLNKASYAYRSDRPFYIWIGNLDEAELNRRETESLAPAFGNKCVAEQLENTKQYYKPIALLVLFDILASSSASSGSIFYLDANAAFTPASFDRIDSDKFNRNSTGSESENLLASMGPESYLDLSPQASLMATQSLEGKMLMNSGLLILRNTQWSRDLASLWWYGRCGGKDELALWLTLYATFSAWTETAGDESTAGTLEDEAEKRPSQFAYPAQIFFDYGYANQKMFMHFRSYAHNLQDAWEAVTERRRKETDDDDHYAYPIPTNTKLYNGGGQGLGPKLEGPIELPHVVVLPPLRSISFNKTIEGTAGDGTSSTLQVDLPRLKSDKSDDSSASLVIYSKKLANNCSEGRCWPYLIK